MRRTQQFAGNAIRRGRRPWLTISDQGLSSLGNFVLAVVVARSSTAAQFGIYAVATSLYWVTLGATRATLGETLLIYRNDFVDAHGSRIFGVFLSGAVIAGALAGGVLALAGFISGIVPLIALGATMPFLLALDNLRFGMFARQSPEGAILLDLTWVILELAAIGILKAAGQHPSTGGWIAMWGLTAGLSVLLTYPALKTLPSWSHWQPIVRVVRRTAVQLLGDFMILQGAVQLITLLLPIVASLSLLGAYKATQVALGPAQIILTSSLMMTVPVLSDLAQQGEYSGAKRQAATIAASVSACAALYTVILTLMPSAVGTALFGATWDDAARLIPFAGASAAVVSLSAGAQVLLRGIRSSGDVVRTRLVTSPIGLIAPLAGAYLGGLTGLGCGLLAGSLVTCAVWWVSASSATRRAASGAPLAAGPSVAQSVEPEEN